MEAFARLLDRLYFTQSTLAKGRLLQEYFRTQPDPDRGWALAAIAGTLSFDLFKRALVKQAALERIDPELFELSYDYVGEMSETVAHLWPTPPELARWNRLPSLPEIIERFQQGSKLEIQQYLTELLDQFTPAQRWALLKLGTGSLRIGVSTRLAKQVLADFGGVSVHDVEEVWHALTPPYEPLFHWLEGTAPRPEVAEVPVFHPVMLSHPLDESQLAGITPDVFQAEWKYDGIRVQLVATTEGRALFSRTGDDIGLAFPDILSKASFHAVLDGELVVQQAGQTASFNALQQRLNRKKPSAKLITDYPAHIILYDALKLNGEDLRRLPLVERRARLETWLAATQPDGFTLSPKVTFDHPDQLLDLRNQAATLAGEHTEGLMLKRLDSAYIPGRPSGLWYKWKREPRLVDAVMMYAERGHGKRSSFYSDYTFGLWQGEELLPVGKAYSGFTDEELKKLDRWVRHHTTNRFGPVREVEKALVLEVAFDSVQASNRHKSGVAMRFPRIHRIRWDKPVAEADQLSSLKAMLPA